MATQEELTVEATAEIEAAKPLYSCRSTQWSTILQSSG